MSESPSSKHYERRYATGELVRRLLSLAWQFRDDCLQSLVLSATLPLLGLAGFQLLGVVINVIGHALDPAQRATVHPFAWTPPAGWTALRS
jgi:ATP-binding cassette subfamily B protein